MIKTTVYYTVEEKMLVNQNAKSHVRKTVQLYAPHINGFKKKHNVRKTGDHNDVFGDKPGVIKRMLIQL